MIIDKRGKNSTREIHYDRFCIFVGLYPTLNSTIPSGNLRERGIKGEGNKKYYPEGKTFL
jgi:hypothetical protein